ncbi:DUF1254 domain-containing protein [Flavobacterium sp. ANB]|uniref:DUF1254 domain-containing protein n=1 Tax=unclassified Flavobacterium TaxID=196869 RepID=UPI0012B6C8F9|nr:MULTISPECIES: DUF1254 domain-containing protein [unclassified Flavobacterium]MBF4516898.1 DUF1254 domain-containing protein [Flavobacterium sp. ANB]MTD69206.1 DUF1214 domain-containing protein [Flavobacterium sp. LC2016-13]
MKKILFYLCLLSLAAGCKKEAENKDVGANTVQSNSEDYEFVGGYPTEATIKKAYDDADLTRAIQAYKFFYPTVSGEAMFKGNEPVGVIANKTFGTLDTKPGQVGFTLNSDTPYGPIPINLSKGPVIIDIPKGPLIVVAMDVNQRWVADMGIPGPDAGNGGKHLLLPPDYKEAVPASGFHVWKSSAYNLIVGIRSLPVGGDVKAAMERIKTVKVYPLNKSVDWKDPTWLELSNKPQNTTPLDWENNIKYWENLNDVIQREPAYDGYRDYYGELAVLGIEKGKPFNPDARLKAILEKAAKIANAQMRVQSFADRRPDRVVWKDRQWEWVALRFEDGDFNTPNYVDLDGRETWFYQAIGASPSMFRRKEGGGSLYWLGLKDNTGKYVDGGKTYKLTIPTPVPAKLFWSLTIYDAYTRSQVNTDQNKAALRSLFELKDKIGGKSVDLYFGPKAPQGKEGQWIKTIPGRGWFAYFRIYGPQTAAFNGSWKPEDFQEVN